MRLLLVCVGVLVLWLVGCAHVPDDVPPVPQPVPAPEQRVFQDRTRQAMGERLQRCEADQAKSQQARAQSAALVQRLRQQLTAMQEARPPERRPGTARRRVVEPVTLPPDFAQRLQDLEDLLGRSGVPPDPKEP